MAELVNAVLAPALTNVRTAVWPQDPAVPLSPADAADAVLKGWLDPAAGAGEAAKSGVGSDAFDVLTKVTGEPPGIQELLFAFRRGLIDQERLVHGIRQSRLRNEWIDVIEALRISPIPASDAVDAAVENQIDRSEAEKIAYENGYDAHSFDILYHTRGRPPGPQELIDMVRRGFIAQDGKGQDVLSLEQGISESAIKDKWIPVYRHLLQYHPPPRAITALERHGAITPDQAKAMYQEAGLSPELAAIYSADASHLKTRADKLLAKSTVIELYTARVVPKDQAQAMLVALGYSAEESAFLFDLADLQRALKALGSAISRIGQYYIAVKIDKTTAVNALNALQVSAAQQDELIQIWELERMANVRIPTAAEIASAFHYKIIPQDEAQAELQRLGYSQYDAWLLLSVRAHEALPNKPTPGPSAGPPP